MTDKQQLADTFSRLGIKFTEEEGEGGDYFIIIAEGKGYFDFYAQFHFDKTGKFIDYGVWE